MELAKVVGSVVATVKNEKLKGYKLLIVNVVSPNLIQSNTFIVALDTVGVGKGELVLVVRGSSARQVEKMNNIPTDASIVGIVDEIEYEGKLTYNNYNSE